MRSKKTQRTSTPLFGLTQDEKNEGLKVWKERTTKRRKIYV